MSTISKGEFCGIVQVEADGCSVGIGARVLECHFECPQCGRRDDVIRAHRTACGSPGFGGIENLGPGDTIDPYGATHRGATTGALHSGDMRETLIETFGFGHEGPVLRTSIPGGTQCQAVTQGPT